MRTYPYGTVLKIRRDDTLSELRRQLELVGELGLNTVVVWPPVYWWERPEGPGYPVATGRRLLEMADEVGLGVVLELVGQIPSLEYAPAPLMKQEYLAVERDGSPRRRPRPYDFINYNHPEVREMMRRYFAEIVAAYRGYRSLVGYDIWNETMFTSFDRFTLELFRRWLEEKYRTIERLNEVWNQSYRGWAEIGFEQWTWASVMPVVDYHQFRKANVAQILRSWRAQLQELDPDRPCIADNIHSMITADAHYERPQDDWSVAREADIFGISFYPKNRQPEMDPAERWEVFAGVRGAAGDRGFWVSELQSHNQSMFNPFNVVHANDLLMWNWEAIANGATGIIYWKWRPFLRGLQTGGRGLINSQGELTERASAAGGIAAVVESMSSDLASAQPRPARVAILYDSLCHDFVKAYVRSYEPVLSGSLYTDSIAGLFRALWRNNIAVDFVAPADLDRVNLSGYRAVFITNQLNIDPTLAKKLLEAVETGTTIIFDGKFGLIDDSGRLEARHPGGPLNGHLGYRYVEVDPVGLDFTIDREECGTLALSGYHERERIRIDGRRARVVGSYVDGAPAVLSTTIGAGQIIGISTFLWYGYLNEPSAAVDEFVGYLDQLYGLSCEQLESSALKTKVLISAEKWYLFAFNYEDEPERAAIRIDGLPWKRCWVESIDPTGKSGSAAPSAVSESSQAGEHLLTVEVGPLSVGIYRLSSAE